MFDRLQKQIESLDAKGSRLATDWDLEGRNALLDFYVRIMPKVLTAERCHIFIYDPATKLIWLRAGTGIERKGLVLGEDEQVDTVTGEVIESGQYKVVHKSAEPDRLHRKIDERTGSVTRDILAIPIKSVDGNSTVGVVEAINKEDGSEFTDADRELLEEMAHYLEVAIESTFFDLEATSLLRKASASLTTIASAILWIIGLAVLAVVARVIWAGLQYGLS